MCLPSRRLEWSNPWLGLSSFFVVVFVLAACGSDAGSFPDSNASPDAGPPTDADAIDTPRTWDLNRVTDVADSPDEAVDSGGLPGIEVGTDTGDAATCTSYPNTSRVDSSGKTYWWYNFDWQQANLADICASYGAGAKMVVELHSSTPAPITGLPACTAYEVLGAGGRSCAVGARLEADCLAGQMLFEADSERGSEYLGYFHIESPQFPNSPRRLIEADATCQRSVHPRFMPMAPAGSPEVGVDTGGNFARYLDPSAYGQPCHVNADCPLPDQACFIEAAVTDCLAGPIGRCVQYSPSNCVASSIGCYCMHFFGGTTCKDFPGTACGNIYPPGTPPPVNPQSGTLCHTCLPSMF